MKTNLRVLLALFTATAALVAASHASAAAGDLDRTFATGGTAVRDLGGFDRVVDVALQGRKTVALVEVDQGPNEVAVMRLLENGRIDRDFAARGVRRLALPGHERPGGVEIDDRGRIVLSFTSDPTEADSAFAVARLLKGGKMDRTFDRDGVQTTGFGTGFSGAQAADVALEGNDIIVAGRVWAGPDPRYDFAVARFQPKGELDSSFAGDGRQTTDFGGEDDIAAGVRVDADGRVVVVGTAAPPSAAIDPLALARYEPDGDPDASFSDDGRLVSEVAPEGADLLTLPDSSVVVAGTVSGDFLVARFTEGGDQDEAFAGDGEQTIDFNDGADRAWALAPSGGKIVVAGTARTPRRGHDFGIARLRADGSLDPSFSDDGIRAADFEGREDIAYGVAVDRTKDVVAGGSADVDGPDTAVLRLQGRGGR